MMIEQHETSSPSTVPEFRPELVGLRAAEFFTLTETLLAKARILLVPRLLAAGALVALLGITARLAGIS